MGGADKGRKRYTEGKHMHRQTWAYFYLADSENLLTEICLRFTLAPPAGTRTLTGLTRDESARREAGACSNVPCLLLVLPRVGVDIPTRTEP